GPRSSFRWAVVASVGLHAALAIVALVAARWPADRPAPVQPVLDTRVHDPPVEFITPEEQPVAVVPPAESNSGGDSGVRSQGSGVSQKDQWPGSVSDSCPLTPDPWERSPFAKALTIPSTLPAELLPLLHRPGPVGPPVVEVPIQPTAANATPAAV